MQSNETLKDFYKRKESVEPPNLYQGVGHFNLFNLEPIPKGTTRPLPYQRRDYYKILLVKGDINFHYADKTASIKKQALVFTTHAFCPKNSTFLTYPSSTYQCFQTDCHPVFGIVGKAISD